LTREGAGLILSKNVRSPPSQRPLAARRARIASRMNPSVPEISIIIPAYNEEARLPRTLKRILDFAASRGIGPDQMEIVVVDDGSTDGTARVVEEEARRWRSIRLVSNGRNCGKGFSVRHGMLEAVGRVALFTDADLSAPIEEADKLLEALAAGNEVAIGSRRLKSSLIAEREPPLRQLAGVIFNGFVRIFTGLPFHDTQCGFKAFVREPSRIIFEQQRIERFGFDPEILFLARHHGLRSVEVGVRWSHDPASKVRVIHDSVSMFGDLLYIRWNWALGRYPKSGRKTDR
jgi:dolichyl-phosphate beta-glucosyltransferase